LRSRTLALLGLLVLTLAAYVTHTALRERDREAASAAVRADADRAYASVEHEHPRIEDAAGILAPFGPRLGRMTDALNDDLGIDVHVVTRTDAAASIEIQSHQTYEERGVGIDARTGGVLILMNPVEGSARIEVGRSLEHALTDLHMSRIAREQLAPYASYGAAGMAVMDVLHYLRDHVQLSVALGDLELPEDLRANPQFAEYRRFVSSGAGAKAALSAVPLDADLKAAVSAARRSQYAPSATVAGSVEAFLRATGDLAGDPTLELFTEGSQLMRAYYPLARFEELRRLERIAASQPLEFIERGDYAVATSREPAAGFVPILLHREDGLWRIDLVETWKNLFFDSDGNYFLRNSNTPYAFGLAQFGTGRHYDVAALPLDTRSIADALESLEGARSALAALERGEIWLRNGFVFPRAYPAYEAARRAAPRDPLILQTIGERALYLGFPELAIPALERVGSGVELKLAEAYNDSGDLRGAERSVLRALEENPYDLYALRWQQHLSKRQGFDTEARRIEGVVAELERDPTRSADPVVLSFDPAVPRFEPHATTDVNGTRVFDHSWFGVAMRNTSNRTVEIESVTLTSMGTAAASGLGDIKGYWQYPAGERRLLAGQTIRFEKVWGFTVDTGHEHVRYVFRTCWRDVGGPLRQCRTQWVDVLP
jgi:tetratricopeptide (TPR) repeat protein